MLEKRVKSRFNPSEFHYYNYTVDKLIEILFEKTLSEYYPIESIFMYWALNDNSIKNGILEKFMKLGVSISWFIQLTRVALMFFTQSEASDLFLEFDKITNRRYIQKLEEVHEETEIEKINFKKDLKKNPFLSKESVQSQMLDYFTENQARYPIDKFMNDIQEITNIEKNLKILKEKLLSISTNVLTKRINHLISTSKKNVY